MLSDTYHMNGAGARMRRTCLIFLTVIFQCVNTAAQNHVGKIVDLDGTAILKLVNGKVVTLTEENFARSLQPNQKLRLNRNGRMRVLLCNDESPRIPSDGWYTVPPAIICSIPADSPMQRVMNDLFDTGARYRGKYAFIFFPIESDKIIDTIRPETAVLRWGPSEGKVNLSISVVGVSQAPWEQNDVPGEDGFFTGDGLRKFLKDVREHHPGASLQLKIHTNLNTNNIATFRLLSKETEEALQKELAGVKYKSGLLSHLFRAEVYRRHSLFPEVAEEYEEALKLSPESIELLRATATLQEQAGNLKRSDELERQIKHLDGSMP